MRLHLIDDLERLAGVSEARDLNDQELAIQVYGAVEDWGPNTAITPEEMDAVRRLYTALLAIDAEEMRIRKARNGGRVVHGTDGELLMLLGWLERVRPLARGAYALFLDRGRLDVGIWDQP